jgi:hypothetical protein
MIKKAIAKDFNERIFYEIDYGIDDTIKGQMPDFTMTANGYNMTKNGNKDKRYKDCVCCGTMSDIILALKPDFALMSKMHCRKINGEPSYAFENGICYLGYSPSNGEPHKYKKFSDEVIARHFMITVDRVAEIKVELAELSAKDRIDYVKALINNLKPMWKAEADKTIETYNLK